ncbi:MAG: site-specific integrase [Pirellulaceae bacterium]|nr:site-specific integrase [Pirellulaceae bacterium]
MFKRLRLPLVVLFSLFCCELLGQDATEESSLLPALSQSELKSRLETLKSIYPDWYERVSDGAVHRKASFAAKLLKDAQGADPSSDGFYPILWESMRFSHSGLDCETGFSAIDLLSSHYDVNAPKLKQVLLEAFGDSSVSAKDVQKAAVFLMPAIQQAADRKDYEVAFALKETGDKLAAKLYSKSLQKDLAQAKETMAHAYRHTYITKSIKNGVDISTVAELVGHANCQMIASPTMANTPNCGSLKVAGRFTSTN